MRILTAVAIFIALVVAMAGCSLFQPTQTQEIHLTKAGDQIEVELAKGGILAISLEANPSTGYTWERVETPNSDILEQQGEPQFSQSPPDLVGAPGLMTFRFKAVRVHETELRLIYHRPFEEGVDPIDEFSIRVVVR